MRYMGAERRAGHNIVLAKKTDFLKVSLSQRYETPIKPHDVFFFGWLIVLHVTRFSLQT